MGQGYNNSLKLDYTKPFLSVDEQLALIKSRGLAVGDDNDAKHYLKTIGYYRLSGYWHPFRKEASEYFINGTKFSDVVELYAFDKKLRLIVLDAIERIEVAVRVAMALSLGKDNPFIHLSSNIFFNENNYKEWRKYFDKKYESSKQPWFITANKKYKELPIWMVIETWDFGLLSYFFSGLNSKYKDIITSNYAVNPTVLKNWLASINEIRNICAHHQRLWNFSLNNVVKTPKNLPDMDNIRSNQAVKVKIYAVLIIIQFLLRIINPTTKWHERLKEHMNQFPNNPNINIQRAGFPQDWHKEKIWQ